MTAPAYLTVPRMRLLDVLKRAGLYECFLAKFREVSAANEGGRLHFSGHQIGDCFFVEISGGDFTLTFIDDDHAAEFALRYL